MGGVDGGMDKWMMNGLVDEWIMGMDDGWSSGVILKIVLEKSDDLNQF